MANALTVHVAPLPEPPLDPLRLFELPQARTRVGRFAWLSPDGSAVVGIGCARGRYGLDMRSLAQVREQGFMAVGWHGEMEPVETGLRHFFGHPFDPDGEMPAHGRWTGFQMAKLVLPAIALTVDRGEAWLTVVDRSDDLHAADDLARLAREVAAALSDPGSPVSDRPQPRLPSAVVLSEAEVPLLRGRVEAALAAIMAGEVRKVVVATSHTVRPAAPPDPVTVLRRLRATQPGCFHYLVQPRPSRALVGASPERLVAVDGNRVRTMALAGSAPRGADPAADEALGAALLASPKDRAEHQLVVDTIREALAQVATSLTVPDTPRLRRLATIQHLETLIEATMPGQGDILDLATRLHPTPALAGTPRDAALAVIRRIEGDTRGWYGGLVGWVNAQGNGDLTVAIRCLLLDGDTVTAFAGAGIVAGSDPDREVAEIALKLQAGLGAIDGLAGRARVRP